MPTISGDEKDKLIELLQKRKVKFYHACQFQDFKTYIQLGGVPCRKAMEGAGLSYTAFDTDQADKENGVWDKVFGNFSDSGNFFAYASKDTGKSIPNIFGPILLVFSPEVFLEATDVAVCLRSAGGRAFNRDVESLSTTDEVNGIFEHALDQIPQDDAWASSKILFPHELESVFRGVKAGGTPEVSCTVQGGVLKFMHLQKIIVDLYQVGENSLYRHVRRLASPICSYVYERKYYEYGLNLKNEMSKFIAREDVTLSSIISNPETSPELLQWAKRMDSADKAFQFNRYAAYLRSGTIIPLSNEKPPETSIFNLGDIPFF